MDDMIKNNGAQRDGSGAGGSLGMGGLTEQAKAMGRDIKNKASEFSDNVAKTAKNQAQGLSAAASDLADQAKGKVESAVNEKKSAGADYIGNIAGAVHRAADEIDGEVPQAAQYIHQAADRLEDVASAVRDRNVRDLVGEVENFARQQPMLFFGGTLLLGFAAIRFLKTSENDPNSAVASQHISSSPSTAPSSY
jgi:cell division septum initiation protein DivIVA